MDYIFKTIRRGALLPFAAVLITISLVAAGCGGGGEKAAPKKEEATKATPGASAQELFETGVQASLQGKYDEAIASYEGVLKLNPNSADALSNMAFAYFDKGDYKKSAELHDKALDKNPDLANSYFGLAMSLEKMGDIEGAVENYQEYMQVGKPHSTWWNRAKAKIEELSFFTEK